MHLLKACSVIGCFLNLQQNRDFKSFSHVHNPLVILESSYKTIAAISGLAVSNYIRISLQNELTINNLCGIINFHV